MSNIVISKLVGGLKKHAPALDSELVVPIDAIDTSDAVKNKAFRNETNRYASQMNPTYIYHQFVGNIPAGGFFETPVYTINDQGAFPEKGREYWIRVHGTGLCTGGLNGSDNQFLIVDNIANNGVAGESAFCSLSYKTAPTNIESFSGREFPTPYISAGGNFTVKFRLGNIGTTPINGLNLNFYIEIHSRIQMEVA